MMDNFFDIATPAELEGHYGEKPSAEEISADRAYYESDSDLNFLHLFLLFLDRGEKRTAEKYFEKIKDPERRLEATMSAYECQG